jgi:hypothetical protein
MDLPNAPISDYLLRQASFVLGEWRIVQINDDRTLLIPLGIESLPESADAEG